MQFERIISLSRLMIGKSGEEKELNGLMMPKLFIALLLFCKFDLHDSSCTRAEMEERRN